jgi:hypothetical protein
MADYKIEEIEGIGAVYGPKLRTLGLNTVAEYWPKGKLPRVGRSWPT